MAITLDNAPSIRNLAASSATLTYSHTRSAGAGVLFVTIAHTISGTIHPTSVTYGGVAMTRIASSNVATTIYLAVYALTFESGNAGGSANVVITLPSSASYILSTSASFKGDVSLASPNFNVVTASGVTSLTNTLSVTSGSWVFIGAAGVTTNVVAGTNVTSTTAENPLSGYYGPKSESGSIALTITSGNDTLSSIAVEFAEPVVGPSITTHPANITVAQTTTASFSVAVTGGTAPYTYQWQRYPNGGSAWANVTTGTGGTAATYTTAATTQTGGSANSGDQYRCVVTDNAALSATSNAATLTVTPSVKYDLVDTTDPITGQPVRVLIPNSLSASPYNAGTPTKAIIYCHGVGETQTALLSDSLKSGCVDALLDAGYILAGSNAFSENWGNQNSVRAYTGLEKYLSSNYNIKGIALWSQSMGGMAGLNVLAQGQFHVVGWLGTYPVCALSSMTTGFGSAINTAYGVTGSGIYTYANQTYGFDPALRPASAYHETPMRFYASSGDTVVSKSANADVLAAIVEGSRTEAAVIVCSGDHGDPSHFQQSDYVAFFNRCFNKANRTVTLSLKFPGGAAAASLSALKWAFYETATPEAKRTAPVATGTGGTTDASGVITLTVSTHLSPGETGWLTVTDSNGNPASDHNAFSGPVTVS